MFCIVKADIDLSSNGGDAWGPLLSSGYQTSDLRTSLRLPVRVGPASGRPFRAFQVQARVLQPAPGQIPLRHRARPAKVLEMATGSRYRAGAAPDRAKSRIHAFGMHR
uniref:Nucleolar and spindle-associated protein 1 n=1 Tax=uncultured bacterium 16 TaxID=1748268 RepID=A0A0U3UHK9_9BACT|nr:nucleolar and spindle-associated protein 1 [uncultured bacterium 16]